MLASKLARSVANPRGAALLRHYCSDYTKHFLMPSAARLVALNHLDASNIVGTGLGGRIMRYDVVAFMEKKQSPKKAAKAAIPKPATPVAQQANFVDEAVDGEKESRMQFDQQVKREIPHAYLSEEVDMKRLNAFIGKVNAVVNATDVAVKAACNALCRQQPLQSVAVNVCVSAGWNDALSFTIPEVQKKSLLAIHEAIEAGKKAGKSMPLSGAITVCSLENVMSGGGILSSQQEVGTITLGSPYSTVRVSEDGEDKIERCVMEKVHFAYNALKLDEISGNAVMSAFKSFMENPEFLME